VLASIVQLTWKRRRGGKVIVARRRSSRFLTNLVQIIADLGSGEIDNVVAARDSVGSHHSPRAIGRSFKIKKSTLYAHLPAAGSAAAVASL
jgi:hypothetical protein